MINFCIIEDNDYKKLLPLTETRPIYDVLVGSSTLFEKFKGYFSHGNITLHCRDYLKASVKARHNDYNVNKINIGSPCLFFNGRVVLDEELANLINSIDEKSNSIITYQNHFVCAYVKGELLSKMLQVLKTPPSSQDLIKLIRPKASAKELDTVKIISNNWDVIHLNESVIVEDFNQKQQFGIIKAEMKPFVTIYNENNVFIDRGSKIDDFVVINAENGPVYIEDNVHIHAHSHLEGPLFIGRNTQILGGAIRRSSIGESCKIAGEVSCSIFHSFSNKAHSGFIGHSYIGQWVNIGAGSTTSNLKNNYSPIKTTYFNTVQETGQQFLGSIIGDHVKLAIGTMLNSGCTIHFGSQVFDHDTWSTKEYSAFSWGPKKEKVKPDAFFETVSKTMNRRQLELNPQEKDLFQFLYEQYCHDHDQRV